MQRILMTRYFAEWVERENITNKKICDTAKELKNGLHHGNLGGNFYKKRIAVGIFSFFATFF